MKLRTSLVALSLLATACYPASRGKDLEARVDKLDADSKELATQLTAERDELKKQAGDLQAKVEDLQGRLDKLEKASRTSDADVGVQIQTVRDDLAQLRGGVEQYQHRIDLLDQGLKDLQAQTDQKIAQARGPEAVKQLQTSEKLAQIQRPTDKAKFLELADGKAASGDTEVATRLYGEWLTRWGKDPLAASVHYSLGKILQDQRREREALSEFGEVAKNFPKSPQAPPALLRSSECFAALGMADASKLALEALVKDYPKSQEGKVAKDRLKKPAPAPKKKGK